MNLVLDPSVVIKWYVPELLSDRARALKDRIDRESVAVPEFFFVECANVTWKKAILRKEITRSEAQSIFSEIMGLPFKRIADRRVLPAAYRIASRFRIAVYDALYLVSAFEFQAKFVTADLALSSHLARTPVSEWIVPLTSFDRFIAE